MKRLLITSSLLILLVATFSSCKKQIADAYPNPELQTTGSMSKLFSGMFLNKRMRPSYWDFATFILPTTGAFSQMTAMPASNKMYIPSLSYTENRWVDFYAGSKADDNDYNYVGPGIMANYREMETTYGQLTADQQTQQAIFLNCGKVVLYDQAAQLVDLWGDIPFTKAGSLNADRVVNPAPFDDAAAIYDQAIADLDKLNSYFATAQLSVETLASFKRADILLGGDLMAWRRYANSLRLRLLMHTSYVKESIAKAAVTAMLGNPTQYPLISDNTQNAIVKMSPTTLKSDIQSALTGSPYAPAFLLDTVMAANNDPRTDVYWDAGTKGMKGFATNGTTTDYDKGGFATYDTATFFNNYNIPGVIFTAAEVSFLKAEAGERWGVGSPQTDYENGIAQSVGFYYSINQSAYFSSGTWPILPTPSGTVISVFIAKPAVAYTGTSQQKLAKIWTQKWVNFFILQAGEAWTEVRRTGYPALPFALAPAAGGANTPPQRLLYPATEQVYNPDNYAKVAAKDKADIKIFWDVR